MEVVRSWCASSAEVFILAGGTELQGFLAKGMGLGWVSKLSIAARLCSVLPAAGAMGSTSPKQWGYYWGPSNLQRDYPEGNRQEQLLKCIDLLKSREMWVPPAQRAIT